jgi:hypothetical protein
MNLMEGMEDLGGIRTRKSREAHRSPITVRMPFSPLGR